MKVPKLKYPKSYDKSFYQSISPFADLTYISHFHKINPIFFDISKSFHIVASSSYSFSHQSILNIK